MKRSLVLLALPLSLGLSGCMTDGYSSVGVGIGYNEPYAYDGWYDGYYGQVHDGYWGNDGYFYYRGNDSDRRFRRGDRTHFQRGPNAPGGNYQPLRGTFQPTPGMHTPSYPRGHRDRH